MGEERQNLGKVILLYFVFSLAMSYLEASVVVYLRKLYYPNGFYFPLKIISTKIALIEIGREAATIVMLVAVALIYKGSFKERFSLFAFTFASWDLFYYGYLELFLHWPKSLTDWDVLFLIPAPWIAPWIAPALVSVALIVSSLIVLFYPERFTEKILTPKEWIGEFVAGGLILTSFFTETRNVIKGGVPQNYCWTLFFAGLLLGILIFARRVLKQKGSEQVAPA